MTAATTATMDSMTATDATSDDARWTAVMTRDRSADGSFVYAVATTGIYCRPSCPARRPARANTRFFSDAAAAREAGFRPCLRCHPDVGTGATPEAARVTYGCRMIEQAIAAGDPPPALGTLADAAGLSPSRFHRLFKAATGVTPAAYARACRAGHIRDRLAASDAMGDTITDAIYASGFGSSGRFYAGAEDMLGMTPGNFRAGGKAEEIRFAISRCALGRMLVAATARGICAIFLGDTDDELLQALHNRFPRAALTPADDMFAATVSQVTMLIDEPGKAFDLPLDIRGTAFQQRVWQALRTIPAGSTISYAALAEQIGAPNAVRAVAGACAANAIAVAIPCHRVVRENGGLSGYRWGVERKRRLLQRESGEGEATSNRRRDRPRI